MEEFKLMLTHILAKVDSIDSRLQDTNITLTRNTVIVDEHKLRSDRLELIQKDCRATCDINRDEVAESLSEIKFYFQVSAAVTAFIVGVIGVLAGLVQIKSVWF